MSQLNINLNKTASDLIHNGAIEYPEGQDSFYMQVVEAVKYKYFILRKVEEKSYDTVTLKLRGAINKTTGERDSSTLWLSSSKNTRDLLKIDHLVADTAWLAEKTLNGDILVHTDVHITQNNATDPVFVVNVKKTNKAFELNELFKIA
jgi:hypothetical protein